MKVPVLFFICTTFLTCGLVAAQNSSLADTPPCAFECLAKGISSTGSKGSLQDILCPNITLQSQLSTCVQTSCQFSDQIVASRVLAQLCEGYPKESRSHEIVILIAIFSAFTFPIAALKFYTRWATSHRLEWDDYAALVAVIFMMALAVLEITSAKLGLGQHYWTISAVKGVLILKLYYVVQIFYIIVQVFAKVSLLLLYIRVFPRTRTSLLSKIVMAFLIIHGTLYFLLIIFQCIPLAAVWDRSISGKCLSLTALGFSGAATSIAEDFFILIIPIFDIRRLQLEKSQKWSLLILFSIGSFACVTSIIRLKYLSDFASSFDATWDQTDVVRWSLVEEFTAVLCACLPSLRSFISGAFHTVSSSVRDIGTSKNASKNASQLRSTSQRLDNNENDDTYALGDIKQPIATEGNAFRPHTNGSTTALTPKAGS